MDLRTLRDRAIALWYLRRSTFDIIGSGATFTRSSEASYYTQPPTDDEGDVAGKAFLAWASSNVARLDSRDGTPMVLLEGSRTNMHTTSRDLGSYTNVGAPVLTDNLDGAPDGDANAPARRLRGGELRPRAARPTAPPPVVPRVALRCAFRSPRPAEVVLKGGVPAFVGAPGVRGAVTACAGPWRASGDWWDVAWSREEWDVALASGGAYRVFLDRLREEWFVEGELD